MPGIKHIEFWVSDLERSVSFYKELLSLIGWEQYDTNGFQCGTTRMYFRERNVRFTENLGPRHICFEADSPEAVDNVFGLLKGMKADIIRGPLEYTYKEDTAYTVDFRDPDGSVIEVATKSYK